jgi:hypothetical protein
MGDVSEKMKAVVLPRVELNNGPVHFIALREQIVRRRNLFRRVRKLKFCRSIL